jgi:uncharacterized protein (DUF1330 family)
MHLKSSARKHKLLANAAGEHAMKPPYALGLAMLVGVGIGATAVSNLRAQNKPPMAYYIVEVEPTDRDAYFKEYAPRVKATVERYGGHLLAAGGKIISFTGDPPLSRVSIVAYDSMEKLQAWHEDPERKALQPIFDRYAKGRSYGVEGISQ